MKNLAIILAVLGIIFVVILGLFISQAKTYDWSGILGWFSQLSSSIKSEANVNANLNAINEEIDRTNSDEYTDEDNLTAPEDDAAVEDVSELNFYTLELGRSDADIQSKRTYTFYLPVDLVYVLEGVDASSSILIFKKDDQEIFKMSNFDYDRGEDIIDEFYPDATEYTFEGGHTNILELLDTDYEDEMYVFWDTLKIDGQTVY
jgi:hypothetical protein